MWAGFVTYGYSINFFAQAIPVGDQKSLVYGTLIAQGFLAAAVVSALFSYPLALLYRKFAVAVAIAMAAPVLVLRLPEIFNFSRHPYASAISSYEVLAYFTLLVAGVWMTRNQLTRSNIAVMRDAPKIARPLP